MLKVGSCHADAPDCVATVTGVWTTQQLIRARGLALGALKQLSQGLKCR